MTLNYSRFEERVKDLTKFGMNGERVSLLIDPFVVFVRLVFLCEEYYVLRRNTE